MVHDNTTGPPLWVAALVGVCTLLVGSCDLEESSAPTRDAASDRDSAPNPEDGTDSDDPAAIGSPCDGPGECVEGARCIGNANGVFSCMRTCDEPWARCEDGSLCTPVDSGERVCYTGGASAAGTTCQSNLQCDDGLLCVSVDGNDFYCLPGCHLQLGGCSSEEFCRPLADPRGYCRDRVGSRCGQTGRSCPEGLECSSMLEPAVAEAFPNGYCTRSCSGDRDCPSGAECRSLPEADTDVCLSTCDFDAECRLTSSYTCLESDDCASEVDSSGCEELRDGESLCVPPQLRDWPRG